MVSNVFFSLMTVLFIVSVVGVVLRYRRAVGDERQQMKWFAFAAALFVGALVISSLLYAAFGSSVDRLGAVLLGLGLTAMPVAMGIAILKHRLYDIDVVINKTIVFGALAGFITLVYIAVVAGVGAVLGRGDEPNLALSVAATALVAVAFQPVRERIQHLANRLVYGVRATLTRSCLPSRLAWARRRPPTSCSIASRSSWPKAPEPNEPRCGSESVTSSGWPPHGRSGPRTARRLRCRSAATAFPTSPAPIGPPPSPTTASCWAPSP